MSKWVGIAVVILRINTIEQNIAFRAVEWLQQDQKYFSCHKIWCKATLIFYSGHTNVRYTRISSLIMGENGTFNITHPIKTLCFRMSEKLY